jgi:hypothetical protein
MLVDRIKKVVLPNPFSFVPLSPLLSYPPRIAVVCIPATPSLYIPPHTAGAAAREECAHPEGGEEPLRAPSISGPDPPLPPSLSLSLSTCPPPWAGSIVTSPSTLYSLFCSTYISTFLFFLVPLLLFAFLSSFLLFFSLQADLTRVNLTTELSATR